MLFVVGLLEAALAYMDRCSHNFFAVLTVRGVQKLAKFLDGVKIRENSEWHDMMMIDATAHMIRSHAVSTGADVQYRERLHKYLLCYFGCLRETRPVKVEGT